MALASRVTAVSGKAKTVVTGIASKNTDAPITDASISTSSITTRTNTVSTITRTCTSSHLAYALP